jgi:hypothetical protein
MFRTLPREGIVEISMMIEGSELAIERLYRGSILNHNSFIIGDVCHLSGRCSDIVTVFMMSWH